MDTEQRVLEKDQALKNLDGDVQLLTELRQLFLDTAMDEYNGLAHAYSNSDYTEAIRRAHSLKSSSATIGAPCLSTVSKKLESVLKTKEIEEARELIISLKTQLDAVLKALSDNNLNAI